MCTRIRPDCIPIFVYRICYTCPILTKIKMAPQRLLCTRWRSCQKLQAGRSRVRFSMRTFHFLLTQSFRWHYGSELDSCSNRNQCQRYLLGDKGGRCLRLTLPPSCADCQKTCDPPTPADPRVSPGLCKDSFINNFVESFLYRITSLRWDNPFCWERDKHIVIDCLKQL